MFRATCVFEGDLFGLKLSLVQPEDFGGADGLGLSSAKVEATTPQIMYAIQGLGSQGLGFGVVELRVVKFRVTFFCFIEFRVIGFGV